jgi:hypothetical protein
MKKEVHSYFAHLMGPELKIPCVFLSNFSFVLRVKNRFLLKLKKSNLYYFINYIKTTILSSYALINRIAVNMKKNQSKIYVFFYRFSEALLCPPRTRSKAPAVCSRVCHISKIKIRIIEAPSYQSWE